MQFSRYYRRWFPVMLTLLVVTSNYHCRLSAADQFVSSMRIAGYHARGESAPIGFPLSGCENESGCMCRGATLIAAVDAAELIASGNNNLIGLAPLWEYQASTAAEPSQVRLLRDSFHGPEPIAGRQLRARLASFLI